MNLLFTGATGFLGENCIPIMRQNNNIISIGRNEKNDIIVDLSENIPTLNSVEAVVHAAGKAHIYPKTEAEKNDFYNVNVIGTRNLLSALDNQKITAFVFISSVSVYGLEQGINIDENSLLNGKSPYATSKIQAESLIQSWCHLHDVDYLILRLPLIVGKKPLGNLGKMISAIKHYRYFRIAKGEANKSMVLATDVAILINKWLHQSKRTSGIFNLTDGIHPSFFELEEGLKKTLNVKFIFSIPTWLGILIGRIGDIFQWIPINSTTINKITSTFTFSDSKARKEIGWTSRSVINHLNEIF